MRLKTRRHRERVKIPRISISQEEITADLVYPAHHRRPTPAAVIGSRGRRR
jgi:hypothetical protein